MVLKRIIKRSLIAVGSALTLTLGIAFAVNAMDNKDDNTSSKDKLAPQTYYYQLNSTSATDIDNPSNYALSKPGNGETECGSGTYICSILDEPSSSDPTKPALTLGSVSSNQVAYDVTKRPQFVE